MKTLVDAEWLPGLVVQFLLHPDGRKQYIFLSEGCHALLGLTGAELAARAELFEQLILPEDRPGYFAAMASSAQSMTTCNWEGRIRIEAWKDIKWINLRCTPHVPQPGALQWDGLITNITQSKLLEAQIKQSRAQLTELSAHIESVKEKERSRIAREIHDDLGGNLTAIKMALAMLAKRLPQDDALLHERADYLDELIDRSIDAVHRIAGDLRPGVLDFGLVEALAWQAGEFEKQSGITCRFTSTQQEIDIRDEDSTALFRIFQEALSNIGKHAGASAVTVQLLRTDYNLRLEIGDNGRGILPSDFRKPKSFGIRGMRERARAMGGELAIAANPGGGSAVSIRIPLRAATPTAPHFQNENNALQGKP